MLKLILLISLIYSQAWASLNITTYNIRNFDYDVRSNTPTNRTHLMQIINKINPDLMAVQEINDTREFTAMITRENYNYGKDNCPV